MEQLSIGQKCYIVNASREPGTYIGLVKAINNNQYEIQITFQNNKKEIRRFDISTGKESSNNPKYRLSVRKYVYTNPKEILKKLAENKEPVKVPPMPVKTEEKVAQEIKAEEVVEEEVKPKKPRKKRTTKKKAEEATE